MQARSRRIMLNAALTYASLGWPVAPAVQWLPDPWRDATPNPDVIADWWRRAPDANIVLATGGPVDALEVPADVGKAALVRLRDAGLPVGPVAMGENRCYFLVAGGEHDRFLTHHERLGAPQLDMTYHGYGDVILLPPSRWHGESMYWALNPGESILARGKLLPTGAELHGTIAYVSLRRFMPDMTRAS